MTEFSIQRGATKICSWHLEQGTVHTHDDAAIDGSTVAIGENDKLDFVLRPEDPELEYRIRIGDVPIEDLLGDPEKAEGMSVASSRYWPKFHYFESGRGKTTIRVESRTPHTRDAQWARVIDAPVVVVPSKLGEESYLYMAAELQSLSRSLIVDLYGKSLKTFDLRFSEESGAFHSREEELDAITNALDRMHPLLVQIARRPSVHIRSQVGTRRYWGSERLDAAASTRLCRQGHYRSRRPISVTSNQRVESFDIPEHRLLKAFLNTLGQRAQICAHAAQQHIDSIKEERPFRDINFRPGPTLYDLLDRPRIDRLQEAATRSSEEAMRALGLSRLSFLRYVPPSWTGLRVDPFQRSAEYRTAIGIVEAFLLKHTSWYDGEGQSVVTKLTHRLFEQWSYLQVVDAFRASGLQLAEWGESLRESIQSRFIVDFDRGLSFEGSLSEDLRLRIRYEPWILGDASAQQGEETLCRGSSTDVAWSPDIVIECLARHVDGWHPVYGIVMDSKYTARVQQSHWSATMKYLEIRGTKTRTQVVKQLWLIAPGSPEAITSKDPAVEFDANGPSCPPDEAVRFVLCASPGSLDEDAPGAFRRFASGTVRFLRHHFEGYARRQ